jgi:uncharacterized delta-60 repeat protein
VFHRRLLVCIPLTALISLLAPALPARAAGGDLDPSFGRDGLVTTKFKGAGEAGEIAESIAIQPNGKTVAAGTVAFYSDPKFAVTRNNRDGTLDTSFGRDGRITTNFSRNDYPPPKVGDEATAAAIQDDGRVLVAGVAGPNGKFALVRYNRNGTLDRSFGGDGKVKTAFGSSESGAYAVAILPSAKILAAGRAGPYGSTRFAVARYRRNGSLDTSFGGDGKVTTRFGASSSGVSDAVIQSDGKIVAVGFAAADRSDSTFALARYNRNGTLDKTFGGDGRVTTGFGVRFSRATGMAIQTDGQILAVGAAGCCVDSPHFALARYNSDGTLDKSFGGDGMVTTELSDVEDVLSTAAVQSDGKVIAAGVAGEWYGGEGDFPGDFALARYNSDGSLDTSFGNGGTVITRFPGVDGSSANDAVLQPNGKIVAGGETENWLSGKWHLFKFALARYQAG